MIPPRESSEFVARMEYVLDVYKRSYNPSFPVVCFDESPRQLIKETRTPVCGQKGRLDRYDYEYERCGVCTVFLANEPLTGKRFIHVKERRTKKDWAKFVKYISDLYPDAERITLVMDNLNTHTPGSLYETYAPEIAKAIWDRFEFVFTPKHGSWLNMAEIELNVLHRQCLNRRIDNMPEMKTQCLAWQHHRNNMDATINWQFTAEDARTKLKRLYPTIHE